MRSNCYQFVIFHTHTLYHTDVLLSLATLVCSKWRTYNVFLRVNRRFLHLKNATLQVARISRTDLRSNNILSQNYFQNKGKVYFISVLLTRACYKTTEHRFGHNRQNTRNYSFVLRRNEAYTVWCSLSQVISWKKMWQIILTPMCISHKQLDYNFNCSSNSDSKVYLFHWQKINKHLTLLFVLYINFLFSLNTHFT